MRIHRELCRVLPIVLLAAGAAWPARGAEDEGVGVYSTLSPSVVTFRNVEGSGTGVVIDANGTILTTAHVVASALPLTVEVEPPGKGRKPVTFKNVTIVGVHPTVDLALAKIDPKEHNITLTPAKLSAAKRPAGERVYAIGNPVMGEEVLTKTITDGVISAVDREIDKVKYYQFTAPINPGNSGGPLADGTGKVIGLVTLRMTRGQAVGFALPLHDLNTKEFVPLSKRKPDKERATLLTVEGQESFLLALRFVGAEGPRSRAAAVLRMYAMICFRAAMIADPTDHDLYFRLGEALHAADEHMLAAAYFVRYIQYEPWGADDGRPYRHLAQCYEREGQGQRALTVVMEGLAKYPRSNQLWSTAARLHAAEGRNYAAAHGYTVAKAIATAQRRLPGDAAEVLPGLRARLTPADTAKLEAATKGLEADLTTRERAADAAFAAKRLYLTVAFAALMKEVGGPEPAEATDVFGQRKTRLVFPESTQPAGPVARADGGFRLGPPSGPATDVPKSAHAPVPTKNSWRNTMEVRQGVGITELKSATTKALPLIPPVWLEPGRTLLMGTNGGNLHRISYPELEEDLRLPLKHITRILVNKAGVAVWGDGELLQLDPVTLECVKRYPLTNPWRINTNRDSSLVYVIGEPVEHEGSLLEVIDLAGRKSLGAMRLHPLMYRAWQDHGEGSEYYPLYGAQVYNVWPSPKGKLVVLGGLHLVEFDGEYVRYISGKQYGTAAEDCSGSGGFSPDGQLFVAAGRLFRGGNLSAPLATLPLKQYKQCQTVAFDMEQKVFYMAEQSRRAVGMFSLTGQLLREFQFGKDDSTSVVGILPVPESRKFFITWSHVGLWLVDPSPGATAPVKPATRPGVSGSRPGPGSRAAPGTSWGVAR